MAGVSRVVVPVALVCLLAGAAIGYVLGLSGGTAAAPQPPRGSADNVTQHPGGQGANPTDSARSGSRDVAPAVTQPMPGPNTVEGQQRPTDGAVIPRNATIEERLRLALEGVAPVERVAGTGRISGLVTEKGTGQPLPGLFVVAQGRDEASVNWARPIPSRKNGSPHVWPSDADTALKHIAEQRLRQRMYYHTTTAADGRYEFAGLEAAAYSVYLLSANYAFSPVQGRNANDNVRPDATLDFEGVREWEVEVEILLPDGSPAKSAFLSHVKAPDGLSEPELIERAAKARPSSSRQWVGPTDRLYLQQGVYFLGITGSIDGEPFEAENAVVHVRDGGTRRVVFPARLKPAIRLSLSPGADGEVDPGVQVYCIPFEADLAPTHRQLMQPAFDPRQPRIYRDQISFDENRRAVLHGFRPGKHVVAAVRDESVLAHAFFEAGEDGAAVTLEIPATPRSEYAVVWVRGPGGELLDSGVSLSAEIRTSSGRRSLGSTVEAWPDGGFRIPHARAGDEGQGVVEPGLSWAIIVRHEVYGVKQAGYQPGPATEVTVRFEAAATLDIEVSGPADHPVRKLIELEVAGADGHSNSRRVRSDGTPMLRSGNLGPFQPGEYMVTMYRSSASGSQLQIAGTKIVLTAGGNACQLPIPDLHELRVSAPQAEPGSQIVVYTLVEVIRPDGTTIWDNYYPVRMSTGSDRVAVFQHLPAGRYRVAISNQKVKYPTDNDVLLPGQEHVTLLPK